MTLHSESQDGTLTRASLQKYLRLVGVDVEDDNGFTPLALAVKNGYPSVVKLLLQNGANADKPVRDGRTPLYLAANAKQNRPRIVQLLLGAKPKPQVDASSPEWGNETPLMVAITQGRDPEVVRLLIEAGASPTKRNDRGDTAQSLADQTNNAAIKTALNPKGQQGGWSAELAQLLTSLVVFALAYFDTWAGVKDIIKNVIRSLYNQTNPQPTGATPPPGTDIVDPQTPEEFKHNIGNIIQQSGLEDFFPPNDPYVQQIAEKAAALRKDQTNTFNTPPQILKLARLALYQPVLYVDDSGSMVDDNKWARATELVSEMTDVATTLVGDNKGIHLRFINRDDSTANNLKAPEVDRRMKAFAPEGWTEIGTNLKNKILKPMVYDVIDKGVLSRPFLVLTVTDGMPSKENQGEFRTSIVECATTLTKKGYQRNAVQFDLSQIGNDKEAIQFIDSFEGDNAVEDVLHRTAENADSRFNDLRATPKERRDWLLDKLSKPVTYKL